MALETLFGLSGMLALAGWASLILLPRWPALGQRVAGLIVPAVLSVAYIGLVAAFWFEAEGGFDSLAAVATLFESRGLLLAGWLHYLAFDLLIGAWIARTARKEGIPHLAAVPSLVLAFLFGPAGYLTFLGVRGLRRAAYPVEVSS